MTFLCYASLISSLPNIVKTTNFISKIVYPVIPYKISLLHGKTKISRLAYREFQLSMKPNHRKSQTKLENKWIRDINCFNLGTMCDIRLVTKNTYLQAFHFRLISRIISTKHFLHTIGIAESNQCTFCSSSIETLFHLFWDCSHAQVFISEIKQKLTNEFNIKFNVSKSTWFFPNLKECTDLEILVITIGKLTIYKAQNRNIPLSINHFLNSLKLEVEKELHLARITDRMENFKRKWSQLESITRSTIQ